MTTTRKVVIGVISSLLLGTFVFGGDAYSYLATASSNARQSVKDRVPVGFEIERAKGEVAKLTPEIQTNMNTIAKEEVQISNLTDQTAALKSRMAIAKDEMLTLQKDLDIKSGNDKYFVYSGRNYTRTQVETDLANRLERYQVDEATLAQLEKMLEIRNVSLVAARQKLQAYLTKKRNIEVALEQLSARLKMIEVAKTTSNYNFDDGRLGSIEKLISELKSRIEVDEKMANADTSILANDVVLDKVGFGNEGEDIAKRVKSYFDPAAKVPEAAVADTE